MSNEIFARGIDVSSWQGEILWTDVPKNTVRFAFVRSSVGERADSRFYSNIKGAQQSDIECGAVHVLLAQNKEQAQREAEFFLNMLEGVKITYPAVVDITTVLNSADENNQAQEIIDEFCGKISAAGYYVIIYCPAAVQIDFSGYDLWLTDCGKALQNASVVQSCRPQKIEGIEIGVCTDYTLKNYPEIIEQGGYNRLGENDNYILYTVKPGDTLWNISQRTGTNYKAIAELNGLLPPYIINAGEQIKIPNESKQTDECLRYTVKAGDTLWNLGRTYGVDYRKIIAANNLTNPEDLRIGQVIVIPRQGCVLNEEKERKIEQKTEQSSELSVGDCVRIKSDAEEYYSGRKIEDWVKRDYTYYITAVEYNGQPVMLGGKRSVLLGRRKSNLTGIVESGISVWVNEDVLSLCR